MADLRLSLMGEYFDQIWAGTKLFEYRAKSTWWKRLEGRQFNWLNEGIQDAHPSALSANELEWLNLLEYLSQDDICEFKGLIRERQERNKRLLKEFEAPPENPNKLRNT